MTWRHASTIAEVSVRPVVWKHAPLQILLYRVGEQVFAIDNRCPHEGYPLVDGDVDADSCVLTCQWHNWKFRLEDGECILGGDHVRSYPTEIRGEEIWVDLTPPPKDHTQQVIARGLGRAYDERDFGRICREIARLHYHDITPEWAVLQALEWSHDHLEFGTTHAYAAAPDWLDYADRWTGHWDRQLVALAECVDHMAFDALRHQKYAFTPAADSYEAPKFLEAIEAEQRESAESMIAAALDNGRTWRELEPTMAQAALAHYNDFGHSSIYVLKSRQLIARLGGESAAPIIRALTRHLCYTTREDLTPPFNGYQETLDSLNGGSQKAARSPDSVPEDPGFCSVRSAYEWVRKNAQTHSIESLYQPLLTALARNLACFDASRELAYTNSVVDNVGWLNVSHGVTFANSVRELCQDHPELWPSGIVQMASFLGRNFRYVDQQLASSDTWSVADPPAFWRQVDEKIIDHGIRDPIFSAHYLKTARAVREELEFADATGTRWLLAGLNRLFHSPLKQKHARRLARQADDLVQRDFDGG